MIQLEQVVVLHGKSGLGKTSLLNAGVLPEKTSHQLLQSIVPNTEGLWYAFKSKQLHDDGNPCYLLVFDQFEEIFTYPPAQVEAFKRELSNLLNATIPADFRKALRERLREDRSTLSLDDKARLHQPVEIKMVLGIRSDRMSLLDRFTDYLPNILVNLYELQPLSKTQAEAAIVCPAQKEEASFLTPPFTYTPAALDKILTHLSGEQGEIEPLQIQYICEYAEEVVQRSGKTTIDADDLGDLKKLFQNYYDRKIAELGDTKRQRQARKLIEEGLLFHHIRLSLLREQITDSRTYNVSAELLRQLENVRLLRAEQRNDQLYYEITHDTLVEPILKAKKNAKPKSASGG